MIYIQDVIAKIEELRPTWEKGTLSQKELKRLYSLFDEVVREARRTRSCFEDNSQSPEYYLLEVFENRTKSTVAKFLKRKNLMKIALEEARDKKKPLHETSTFQEWMHYGRQIILTIILGDATERHDRRKIVKRFLEEFESSEEKHLTLNYKPIKASFDAHLGLTGTHKKPGFLTDLMRPEALNKTEIELKEFSEKKRGPFLDGVKGSGFIIKDASAIEAAIRLACQQGIGYDLDYKRKKLKDLTFRRAIAMKAFKSWQREENHHRFKTGKEVTEWIENRVVGRSLTDMNAVIQSIRKRNPNIVNFLFGSKATQSKKGKLYYRLLDLWKLKEKRRSDNRKIVEELRVEEREKLRIEIGNSAKEKDDHNPLQTDCILPKFWEAAKPFLTKKQQNVLQMRYIEHLPVAEIAKTLNRHPRTIFKHLNNIKKTLAENEDQLNHIRLTLLKDLFK